MDAASFFGKPVNIPRSVFPWFAAIAKSAFGAVLVFGVVRLAVDDHTLLAGWLGMIGIVFLLHFGLAHVLSLAWRRAGVNARPIMQAPILASSLGELWGRRWNLAFRDLAHAYVFRPLLPGCGLQGATMAVFIASGLIHDLAISVPAGGGGGLPTLYFVIQGLGVLLEHSRFGKALGLGEKLTGRLFTAVIALGPLPWLFHAPFVERVVLPLLRAMGAW
jgi:alginate O-acetyltransferase complex protein AlgI